MTGDLTLADGSKAASETVVDTKIATAVGSAGHLKRLVVEQLPEAAAADVDTIYMVKDATVTTGDAYKEYMVIDGAFAQIGDTSVNLEPYAKTADVETKVKVVQDDLDKHKADAVVHITADERTAWNDKLDADNADYTTLVANKQKLVDIPAIKTIGTGLTLNEDGSLVGAQEYELPVAAANKLGGVKAGGAGVSIAADGVISAKVKAGNGLSVGEEGIILATATDTTAGAMTAEEHVKMANFVAMTDDVTWLKNEIAYKAPAIIAEELAYYHDAVKNRSISVEGNTFTRDTVKIVSGKNRVITLRSYDTNGVSLFAHDGRFISMSGSLTADTMVLYLQAAKEGYTDSAAIKGKRIRVVTQSNVAVSANGYNGAVPALVVRNGDKKFYTNNCDKSDIFNHDFFVDIPEDAGEITLSLWYLESGVNLDNVEFFAGIYFADDAVIDTGEIVNNGDTFDAEIPEGITAFDSMTHRSVQSVIIDTKTYIDSKTPENILTYEDLQYLSPEMYGAVGDGVADDADAVQTCVDDAIAKGIPVRGYGSYKCSRGINIKCDYGDFYLHKIEISAGEYVVKLIGTYNTVRIDNVRAYNITGAAGFRFATDAETNCESNDVSLGGSTAYSNAIEFINDYGGAGRWIYYNRLSVQRLFSQFGSGIHMYSNAYDCMNENSIWAKYVSCQNDYAIYSVGGGKTNRIYEICCEHNAKNVAYGSVSLINPRVSDCLNETAPDRGILFKIVNEYPSPVLIGEIGNWKSVDVSEAMSFEDCKQRVADLLDAGNTHGEAFYKAFSSHKMSFPVVCEVDKLWIDGSVAQFNSRHCPPGKIIVYFNHKGYVPSRPWRNSITTSEYRPFETDGRVPTIFEIDADTTIYLEDSYCCIGINEVMIVQKDGHKATVYGKDYNPANPSASLIFDGTSQENGTYKLHCEVAPFSFSVEYSGGVREYNEASCESSYFGSNDKWTVEKVNVL